MNVSETPSEDSARIFDAIDAMVEHINRLRCDPGFTLEVERRTACRPDPNSTDEDLLERMIYLIAYNNNAQSDAVTRSYNDGAFKRAFLDYSVKAVAGLVPEGVIEAHWHELKPIRFKYKAEGLDLTRGERRPHGFIATQRKPRSVPR